MMLDTPNVDSSQPSILVVGLFSEKLQAFPLTVLAALLWISSS